MLQSLFLLRTELSFLFEEDLIPWPWERHPNSTNFSHSRKIFPKVCSHCVSRRTLHLHVMVPLLHPSKVTLDACMLHQEELTGGFNTQGDWTQSTGVPTRLANQPRPSLHNAAENQNTRHNSGPMRLVGEFLCVRWRVQGSWSSLIKAPELHSGCRIAAPGSKALGLRLYNGWIWWLS